MTVLQYIENFVCPCDPSNLSSLDRHGNTTLNFAGSVALAQQSLLAFTNFEALRDVKERHAIFVFDLHGLG